MSIAIEEDTQAIPDQAAEAAPVLVLVNDKPFQWTPEVGLDPSAVGEVVFFVRRLAQAYLPRVRGHALTLDDLIQEGVIGALEAARRFDPSRGFKYLTYAEWWIRKHLHDMLREDVVSLSARDVRAGVPAFVRLDAPLGDREDGYATIEPRGEVVRVGQADQVAEAASSVAALREAVKTLSPMEQDILWRRFGLGGAEPEILESIATTYQLSRERIRQREIAALAHLRRHLNRRGLKPGHLLAEPWALESMNMALFARR